MRWVFEVLIVSYAKQMTLTEEETRSPIASPNSINDVEKVAHEQLSRRAIALKVLHAEQIQEKP